MAVFSPTSLARLSTCDERLQRVKNEAIKYVDIAILCGERSQADQEQAFHDGKTNLGSGGAFVVNGAPADCADAPLVPPVPPRLMPVISIT